MSDGRTLPPMWVNRFGQTAAERWLSHGVVDPFGRSSFQPHPSAKMGVSVAGLGLYKAGHAGGSSKRFIPRRKKEDPDAPTPTDTCPNLKWLPSCRWVFHLIVILDSPARLRLADLCSFNSVPLLMNEIVTEDCEGCRTPLQMTRVSVTRYAALSTVTRCLYWSLFHLQLPDGLFCTCTHLWDDCWSSPNYYHPLNS